MGTRYLSVKWTAPIESTIPKATAINVGTTNSRAITLWVIAVLALTYPTRARCHVLLSRGIRKTRRKSRSKRRGISVQCSRSPHKNDRRTERCDGQVLWEKRLNENRRYSCPPGCKLRRHTLGHNVHRFFKGVRGMFDMARINEARLLTMFEHVGGTLPHERMRTATMREDAWLASLIRATLTTLASSGHAQKPSSARPTQLNANIEQATTATDANVTTAFAEPMTRTLCR